MGYSAMIAQGRALSKKEKEKKTNSSHDEMVSSLLNDLEENPYSRHYQRGESVEPLVASLAEPLVVPLAEPSAQISLEGHTKGQKSVVGSIEKPVKRSAEAKKIPSQKLVKRSTVQAKRHAETSVEPLIEPLAKPKMDANTEVKNPLTSVYEAKEKGFKASMSDDNSRLSTTVHECSNGQSWTDVDSPNGQSWTVQMDSREQSWTHVDSRGQSWTVVDSRERLNTAIQMGSCEQSKATKPEANIPTEQQDTTPLLNKIAEQNAPFKTNSQRILAAYLKALGSHITSHANICNETGLSMGTVRRQLRNFQAWGMIKTERHYGYRNAQGMRLTVFTIPSIPEPIHFFQKNIPTDDEKLSQKMDSREEQKWTVVDSRKKNSQTIHDCPRLSISPLLDRKKESIYLSKKEENSIEAFSLTFLTTEDIAFYWPNLAMIDFGESQIRQIFERLLKVGKAVKDTLALNESVRQGLTHADAALSMGKLVDHKGVEVTDPRAYIFRALARDGYYAAPKGYISPEAQKLRDEAEQARILRGLQKQRAEQEQAAKLESAENSYAQWRENLSAHQLEHIQAQAPVHAKKGTPFEKWLQLVHYPTLQS